MISASALERVINCPGSEAFPPKDKRTSSVRKAADRGTQIHAYLEARINGADMVEGLKLVDSEYRGTCVGIDINQVPKGETEVALAYNVLTGTVRYLGKSLGRDYERNSPLLEGEIPGTWDVSDNAPWCLELSDFKTGNPNYIDPVAVNHQMLFLALCAALYYGRDLVSLCLVVIDKSGRLAFDRCEVDIKTLRKFGEKLRTAWEQSEYWKTFVLPGKFILPGKTSLTPEVNMGKWCTFCPSKHACPPQIAIAKEKKEQARQRKIRKIEERA